MGAILKIDLNENHFIRDPEKTELGRNIIRESILMIDELGFEHFTFKKLAFQLSSTEASVYRYFENKHKLLIYLISWYWVWLDYQIKYGINNIENPREKLMIIIGIISKVSLGNDTFTHIDAGALYRIVVAESSKAYLTKAVDSDNKEGLFREYKSLCHNIATVVLAINPAYPYPHALISTLFEASKIQIYFAQHLPSLTEAKIVGNDYTNVASFLESLVFSSISTQ